VIPELQKVAKSHENAQSKMAAFDFSSGVQWVPQYRTVPVEAEKFQWNYIDAEGTTDFGMAACMELNRKHRVYERGSRFFGPGYIFTVG